MSAVLLLWLHLLAPQSVISGATLAGVTVGLVGGGSSESPAAATDIDARCSIADPEAPHQVDDGGRCFDRYTALETLE